MNHSTTARDFFLHLFSTILLYMGVISLLTLLFAIINNFVPDSLATINYYDSQSVREQARFAIAMLAVVAPVYFWSMRFIAKAVKATPTLKDFTPRRWLMYLTIFAAALIIVITLITVVFRFLDGETTARFFLKVLSVLAVAASMFWYYLNEAKGEHADHQKYIAWVSVGLIILSLIGGFFVMGSPAEQRNRRFDQERISDLQTLQWNIKDYALREKALPESLDEIIQVADMERRDPETGEDYRYSTDGNKATLCATFSTVSEGNMDPYYRNYPQYPEKGMAPTDWSYAPGETCFTFDVNIAAVTTFAECVAAGNPVMESYPEQCSHNGELFVNDVVVKY